MDTATDISAASDDELMQGIVAAEQTAFNTLYLRHRLLLRKIVGQVLVSDADVEETVQDVFMEVWSRAARFDPCKGKALGWIICMARRRALDRLRRVRRVVEGNAKLQESALHGVLPAGSEAGEDGGKEPLAARDLRRALDGLIGLLPSEQQTVIDLVFFRDLSQRQVAARTGVPLGTIKTRLMLAIAKLTKRSQHLRGELEQFA